MLSSKCKCAIRALAHVASKGESNVLVSSANISAELDVPESYINDILEELVSKNILSVSIGTFSGFYLTAAQRRLKLIQIVHEMDGLERFNKCIMDLKTCSDSNPCPLHHDYSEVRNKIYERLSHLTIGKVSEAVRRGDVVLV